jgi:hypothetical protein
MGQRSETSRNCGIIYIFSDPNLHGDPLMKTSLILAFIACCAALHLASPSLAEEVSQELLIQDSGNDTTVNLAGIYASGFLSVAETVKFTPPRPSWTLDAVQVLGWDGYEENGTLPEEQIICMEIRDENLNLLYRFTDSQLPYFTFIGQPGIAVIEVPSIPIKGDFYVCFYDRGAVDIGLDRNNAEGNSYFYDSLNSELVPAEVGTTDSQELLPVNWIIRAVGH